MEKYELKNNLNLYYYPINSAQSISIDLFVKVGSRNEDISNNGITHMLEHMHFRQLGTMNQEEIYFKMEQMGNTLQATTYKELLRFYVKTRHKNLMNCLEYFKQIITSYNWSQEQFEAEKKVVLNQILMRDSYFNIDKYVSELLWNGDSLGFPIEGTKEVIEKLTLEELLEFKRRYFNPDNIFIVISGCININDIEYINDLFSQIKLTSEKKIIKTICPNYKTSKIAFMKNNEKYFDVNISFIVDYELASIEEIIILSSILGGGDGAILCMELREKLGITSNIYSDITTYSDIAVFEITLNIYKENLLKGLTEIFYALNKSKTKIVEKDMDINIPFYTDNLWYWLENPCELNLRMAWEIITKKNPALSVEQKISIYKNVTKERLMCASKEIFKPENVFVAIAGAVGKLTKKEIKNIIRLLDQK